MSIKQSIIFLVAAVLVFACGEGTVKVDSNTFQPKIVIQGYLFPHQPVEVRLMRNFPLDATIGIGDIILRDARATITDEAGQSFPMTFDVNKQLYINHALDVEHGTSYTLDVSATIDAEELSASSTTTVPTPGFEILESQSRLDSMFYRERSQNGELQHFEVVFNRAVGTDFYAYAVNGLEADTSTFIYDNPFESFDAVDVLDDFEDFKYTWSWIQDQPRTAGESRMEVFWFSTWFYGDHEIVVYGGDRNFRDFLISQDQVQEIDGNFHEPALHIDGDGIGVFGSAVSDTAYFKVLRRF